MSTSTDSQPSSRRAALRRLAGGLGAFAIGAVRVAQANEPSGPWPAHPIRLICPYPTGGVSDSAARALAEHLAATLKTSVLVDNKPGASGVVGIDALVKSAPDGLTLAFSALSPLTLSPHRVKVPYRPLQDIAPVARVMLSPVLIVATPAFKGKGFSDVLETARREPGTLTFATSGTGSVGHLMLEEIRMLTGVDIVHVPYKGGSEIVTDAIGGQFALLSANPNPAIDAQLRKGALRLLAVAAPARLRGYPQVPTLDELGLAQASLTSTFGVFAPAGTPTTVVERVHRAVGDALAQPDFTERLAQLDNLPAPDTTEAFASQVAREFELNGRILKAAHLAID